MYDIPADAKTALQSDHILELVLEVYSSGGSQLIATTEANSPVRGQILVDKSTGEITCDRTGDYVRNFRATIVDEDAVLVPGLSMVVDPLYRPWIKISYDLKWYTNAGVLSSFRIPAGVFTIGDCNSREYHGGAIHELSGNDIGVLIAENPWTEPFDFGGVGIKYDDAIAAIINDRAMNFTPTLSMEPSNNDCPAGMFSNSNSSENPFQSAKKLAEADGKELFVGQSGTFKLRSVPTPYTTNAVWKYDQSKNSMRLAGDTMARKMSTNDMYNGVIVKATAPWLLYEIIGIAWDTDPLSSTFYQGPFGRRAKTIENNLVGDQAGADAAAAAELKNVLGIQEEVAFEAVLNPAHELGDVVTSGSTILGIQENVLLQTFTLPFDVKQSMRGTCRRQRRGANLLTTKS